MRETPLTGQIGLFFYLTSFWSPPAFFSLTEFTSPEPLLGAVDAGMACVLQWQPGARGAPHGDEARPNCRRLMYVAANGFYLADGRGGRSFFVAPFCQTAYREQSRGMVWHHPPQ